MFTGLLGSHAGHDWSAAEILEIRHARIVRGELIYDAEELRKATSRP